MRSSMCKLVLLLALSACASGPALAKDPLLEKFLAESMSQYSGSIQVEGLDPDFEDVLYVWAKAGAKRPALDEKAAAKYHLPPALASRLVGLTLEVGANESEMTPALAANFLALARDFPDNDIAFAEAANAIRGGPFGDCELRSFDPLLALRTDQDAARLLIFDTVWCLGLLTERTSLHPGESAPYYDLAERTDELSEDWLELAVLRIADERARTDPALSEARRTDLRRRRIVAELEEGRFAEAVSLLPRAPQSQPLLLQSLERPTRIAVVGAFAFTGDAASARAWRATVAAAPSVPAGKEHNYDRYEAAAQEWTLGLVDIALAPLPRDDFLFFSQWFKYESNMGANARLWRELLARLALAQGYTGFQSGSSDWLHARLHEEAVKSCVRCAPELLAMIETVAAGDVKSAPRAPGASLPPALLAQMDRVMALPRPAWREQAVPAAQRSQRAPKPDSKESDLTAMLDRAPRREEPRQAWAARLPKGVLVRFEQQGHRLVAVTASQTLDPTGELSSGGYWLSVSEDGGEHFAPPLYTGLRMYEPYVVLTESKLPMLDGDRIRLEVAVRKLDDEHVTLPPVSLGFLEQRDDVYLEASLDEIARDSDEDGLSDLAEWAMLLAPDLADTDGDGIADGRDPLPHVAGNTRMRGADAMAFALNTMMGKSLGALVTTDATGEPGLTSVGGPDTDLYHADSTQFMAAPPAYFAGLSLKSRLIVLDDSLLERLSKARGISYAMGMENFEVSHDGNSAVLKWSTGWAGGAMLLTRKGDSWEVEQLASWIT